MRFVMPIKITKKIQICRNYFCHEHILLDMRQNVVTIITFICYSKYFQFILVNGNQDGLFSDWWKDKQLVVRYFFVSYLNFD